MSTMIAEHDATKAENGTPRRWGRVERLSLELSNGHDIHYDADADLGRPPGGGTAEGGMLTISLDVDGEDYTRIDLEAPPGWAIRPGERGPLAMVRRAIEHLMAVQAKLEQIEAIEGGQA